MISLNINRPILLPFYIFVMIVPYSVDSIILQTQSSIPSRLVSLKYKRLAKYCYIDDYPAWLERRHDFMVWLNLAKMLHFPIHEDKELQRELKKYHLQYQCLRIMERLPVSFGPG